MLTLIIELSVSLIIGIRKEEDIISVIAVNTLTNPIVVFIANIIYGLGNKLLYWVIVIIMEIIVVFVEGKIFDKALSFKKLSGLKVSFINNFISFTLGLIISLVPSSYLKVEAASSFYPMSKELFSKQDFLSDVKMKSTNEVYEDIINGKTDIIVVTKASDEQKTLVDYSGVQLEYKVLYREPLAIFVNKESDINNMSIEEIQDAYYYESGNLNTYQLEKNNGSQTCFESIVKGNTIGNNHYEIKTMPEIIDRVAEDKNGIGYAFYSYYSKMYGKDNVKIIDVDGKNIFDEDYPLKFEVYLIYRKDNKNKLIYKLIENIENRF
jgi:hypothetical protein